MTRTPEILGYRMGWDDACRYATGTRTERRAIRHRLAKSEQSWHSFWTGWRQAFEQRIEAFAVAIMEGRLPRTCNPHKLLALPKREWARAA